MREPRARVGRLSAALAGVLAIFAAAFSPLPATATLVVGYAQQGSEAIVGGVTHEWGATQTDLAAQRVNVVHVAHAAPDVHFELGLPFGQVNARQTTSDQALAATTSNHRVVAATNGDFWQTSALGTYAPVGLNVRDRELIAGKTNGQRGAFGIRSDGSVVIGSPALSVTITLPSGESLAATGVNTVRGPDELIVYTPRYGATTGTDPSGVEIRLAGAVLPLSLSGSYSTTVAEVRSAAGDTPIAPTELVLSAAGAPAAALAALQPTDGVSISISIDPDWQDVVTAVGGVLLFDGDNVPDFTDLKDQVPNPRTAVGVTADGDFLMVTVDGRSEDSGGMPLTDLVALTRSLGAVGAVDLDGGGSSTVVVDPDGEAPLAVANSPSDGHERRVNTTLQVVSTAPGPPVVSAPLAQIVPNVATGRNAAAIQLSWTPAAPGSVAATELQQLGPDGLWSVVGLTDPRQVSVVQNLVFGKTYQFRVRVTDLDGATSDWALSRRYIVRRFNEGDRAVTRVGNWLLRHRSSALGRRLARNTYDGLPASISVSFTGVQVALVAQTGPTGAAASVTVSGQTSTVDLFSARTQPRMVVLVQGIAGLPGVNPAQGSMSVANSASTQRPYLDVDAFLVLTTR